MTPDEYLTILSNASATDHPFLGLEDHEELGATFVKMAHGMAEFVEACRAHPDMTYTSALANIEDVVHFFPKEASPNAALVAALNRIFATQDNDAIDQEVREA